MIKKILKIYNPSNSLNLRGIYRTDTIYDKLIFNKIRAKFGGRAARVGTGSAPISDEVMIFCRAALGCPIPEGYGQTEATCGITFTHPFDPVLGKTKISRLALNKI